MAGALSFLNHSMDGGLGNGAELSVSPQDPLPVTVVSGSPGIFNPVSVRLQAPPTFSAVLAFNPTASGAWIMLQGSATKLITVTRCVIAATKTAASFGQFFVFRSSNIGGGTYTGLTAYKMDSSQVAATAVPKTSSAPGTAPTIVSVPYNTGIFFSPAGTAPNAVDYQPSAAGNPLLLRGVNEFAGMSCNVNDGVFTGLNANVTIEWTEE